jgi:hypothetical protein
MISKRSLLVAPALILPSRRLARTQSLLLLAAGSSNGNIDPNAIIVAPTTVSPAANDSNIGTLAAPVATLEQAQTLVRRSSVTKTVYLRAGTYSRTRCLVLTSRDNGETWATYPDDPVGNAVLDYTNQRFSGAFSDLGSPSGCAIMAQGTSNVTIDGLTIQNYPAIGILCYAGNAGSNDFGFMTNVATASNVTVKNCSFINGGYGAFPPWYPTNDGQNVSYPGNGIYATEVPAIWFIGATNNGTDLTNGLITHNYIYKHPATAIMVQSGAVAEVTNNCIQATNSAAFDTGCIYNQFTSGCVIKYNYIRDGKTANARSPNASGNSDRDVRAIYCDNSTNNITMQFNIVAGHPADTSGTSPSFDDTFKACMFGVGTNANQNFSYNIIDMGTSPHIAVQNSSTGSGNQFVGNIIISNFSGNPSSPSFGSWFLTYSNGSPTPLPFTCGPNAYHNYGGGSIYTTGDTNSSPAVSDRNPQTVDPKISGWTYNIDSTSPVISAPINFPPLPLNWGQPGFWGPPGFTIPQSGTDSVPSCPH